MTKDIDQLYQKGVAAIRAQDRDTARSLLEQVVNLDPTHDQAWLWLSSVVDNDEERITCLKNVLTVDPYNEEARRALEKLGASLDIDTNAAGEPVPVPPEPHHEPKPPPKMEHTSAPAVDALEDTVKGDAPPTSQVIYGTIVLIVVSLLVIAIVVVLNSS